MSLQSPISLPHSLSTGMQNLSIENAQVNHLMMVMTNDHRPQKSMAAIAIGMTLSILLHVFIAYWLNFHTNNLTLATATPAEMRESFQVQIVNSTEVISDQTISQAEPATPALSDLKKPVAKLDTPETQKTPQHTVPPSPLPKPVAPVIQLEDIRQNIRRFSSDSGENNFSAGLQATQEALGEDSIVVDSQLRKTLNRLLRRQQIANQPDRQKEIDQQNDLTEFVAQGDTQIVRLNGRCFQLISQSTFAVNETIWLPIPGECALHKPLDFSKRKLDQEYLNSELPEYLSQ